MDIAAIEASVVGGLISGLLVGALFYYRATRDLSREASQLRKLNEIMLRAMEEAGYVELSRDASGQTTGFVIKLKASVEGTARATGSLTTERGA